MVEGTCLNQLAETVASLHVDNTNAKEIQNNMWAALGQHDTIFDTIKGQLSNLTISYEKLSKDRSQGETNGETSTNKTLWSNS
jgi:hypothetical protein